jgi:ribulose-5-phosphate 4-epimerase/fuculose-1-phosphate aldolase
MAETSLIVVREFDADLFHKKVLEMEAQGYVANRDTYRVVAEMDPETGNIVHLHSIEMTKTDR